MKIERIDHIHIYVKDLEKAMKRLSDILGTEFIGPIDKRHQGRGLPIRVAFDKLGFEVISPAEPDTPHMKWMEKHGEGVASIAFKVPDIEEAIAELEAKGVKCLRKGTGIKDLKAATFSPENAHGLMIELVEYKAVPPAAMANLDRNILAELPWFEG